VSLSGYDRWLTTDQMAEAQQAEAEQLIEAWEIFATNLGIDPDISEDSPPDHAVYQAWYTLTVLVDNLRAREEAEAEAARYEDEKTLEEHFREGFDNVVPGSGMTKSRAWSQDTTSSSMVRTSRT
jgi:hypothetical protein